MGRVTRFLIPRSLLGQVMLVLAAGLLVGQTVSAVLLYRASLERHQESLVNSIAIRLIEGREKAARYGVHPPLRAMRGERDEYLLHTPPASRAERFLMRTQLTDITPEQDGDIRLSTMEHELAELLEEQGVAAKEVVVLRRLAGDDPIIASRPRLQARFSDPDWRKRPMMVAAIRLENGKWQVARMALPREPRRVLRSILLQTLVIFVFLTALLYPVLRRITRPLAQLTNRVEAFAAHPGEAVPMEECGPDDMRRLIAAHNAMETRIAALLDEKDVMLGAIGHDLKTPLAALRVRIESVADATQRARMAQSIEDITRTLDDILNLARVGRSSDPLERTDLAALTASVVEEFEDMGDPVELGETQRLVAPIRATWLRRALRNLISNALRYGEKAQVTVLKSGKDTIIRVDDIGPGIPDNQIASMMEPFQRGEASRNRGTGGAGLGLTLARAIAEQHGGRLELSNRPEGGLRAEIHLPH